MDNYNEVWKQISGYGNYYVSNFGRVKNIETEKILKPWINSHNYEYVSLSKSGKVTKHSVHRLVGLSFIQQDTKLFFDHIDGNTRNNAVSNLRLVTNQQNMFNCKSHSDAISKHKGVSYRKDRKKWRASVMKSGVTYNLGVFETEEEASKAYNKKAIELFGEFAKLNDVD